MENKIINIGIVKKIALALQELREKIAFVGGAVISVYADDPTADELRPTKDIDLSVTLENYNGWVTLQNDLARLNFSPDPTSPVVCRFLYEDVSVDIMPDDENVLGFSNPWYKPAFQSLVSWKIPNGPYINVFSLPYFLATNFSAFHGRGNNDYRGSHDFEDVIYLTDYCMKIVSLINDADIAVRKFLIAEFQKIWENPYRLEIISCHLSPLIRAERYTVIANKINAIVTLDNQ